MSGQIFLRAFLRRFLMAGSPAAIALALCMVLTGCVKNRFEVEFDLPSTVESNYRLSYYAAVSDGGRMVDGVAVVKGGKGMIQGVTKLPTFVWVFSDDDRLLSVFYAERGDKIVVSSTHDDPASWRIGGNKLNELWSEWRIANAADLTAGDQRVINGLVTAYVEKNPDSPLSAALLLTSYSRRDDPQGFDRLWSSLGKDARAGKLLEASGRTDLTASGDEPQRLDSLRVHSLGGENRLIKTADADATILFCWDNHCYDRNATIDSMKRLLEKTDRLRLQMADLSFDLDSISWSISVRHDSVPPEQWIRGWSFRGPMETALEPFHIPDVPYVMLFDRSGRKIYGGRYLSPAERGLSKIKPSKAAKPVKTAKPANK